MAAAGSDFSFSRMTTFEQCARRFRYRYLDGVKEAFQGVEAFVGQQVHAAVEWLYDERDAGRTRSAEDAVGFYCKAWDAAMAESPRLVRVIKRGTQMESYRRGGADMLSRYHRERFAKDRMTTVENEMHFRIELADGIGFQGYIDRLARDADGLMHVIDYKTGRQSVKSFAGKEADQLEAYSLGVFAQTEVEELELVLDFLRTGDRLRRRIARDETPAIAQRLVERITAAKQSTVFPPTPGVLCDWCGYNDICDGVARRSERAA